MTVELITIGDELLIGQIVNTNASWLGQQLSRAGAHLRYTTTVGDSADDIHRALKHAMTRTDIVLMTGGLGPTHDDITKKVVADFFDSNEMSINKEVLQHVTSLFSRHNRPISPINEQQALVPNQAKVLWNDLGTAPGLLFKKKQQVLRDYAWCPC